MSGSVAARQKRINRLGDWNQAASNCLQCLTSMTSDQLKQHTQLIFYFNPVCANRLMFNFEPANIKSPKVDSS